MTERETRAKWFLDLAWDREVPFDYLFPEVKDLGLNARPTDSLRTREDRREGLIELAYKGLITVQANGGAVSPDLVRPLLEKERPTEDEGYRITPQGGALWESLCKPNWQEYVGEWATSTEQPGVLQLELFGQNFDRLVAYLAWYPQIREMRAIFDSIRWEFHSESEVTYWKRLPNVHRITADIVDSPADRIVNPPAWLRELDRRLLYWREPTSASKC